MSNVPSIETLSEKYKARKQVLEQRITQDQDELGHIEYFLKNLRASDPSSLPLIEDFFDSGQEELSIADLVVIILKEKGRPMKSRDIFKEVEKRRKEVSENSVHSVLSVAYRQKNSPVKKVGRGKYKYQE